MNDFIPVNQPVISSQSKRYVNQALNSGWVSSAGEFVDKFEAEFSKYIGVKYGIAVTSGTAALHVALLATGVGEGDEVIVPAFTMAATWLAVLYVRAVPVFIDCEPETYNIDTSLVEQKITRKTKAIIPVDIYGHSADMDSILRIARKHKLVVIEDAAEAHGGIYKGKICGSMADIACFSFYGNKIITTGEGGMVLTNNKEYAEAARAFKDLCHSPKKRFIHDGIGYNYRMTNLQAALGVGELENIDKYLRLKLRMANIYKKGLQDVDGIKLPITNPDVKNVYWMYAILVDKKKFDMDKDQLRQKLLEKGIDTRDFFYPPKDQPILRNFLRKRENFPITDKISKEGLYLPSGLALTKVQQERVIDTILEIKKN
jgi:perosamine synthetase